MAEPLRIFHLIKSLGRGGAEQLLLSACRHRGETTYGFGYFVPHKDQMVEPIRRQGCQVVAFGGRGAAGILARVPQVALYLRRWRPDLVHCHLPLSGVAGRLAGRLAGIPVVYTEHNLIERYHPWTRRANLATWRLQEAVVAVSRMVADSLAAHAASRVPVRVITNGVPVDILRADPAAGARVRRELGIPPSAPVIGQVAVFRSQKRLDRWVEVAARVLRSRPDSHFVLVGDGPLRAQVETWKEEAGVGANLHLPGLQAEVGPYLSAMDLLLVTSEFEGLPLATLEAMSHGLAVVASTAGGLAEVVVDGETGRLLAPSDVPGLAAAVAALVERPEERERMGKAGRRRVVAHFSTERMMRSTEDFYREVLAGGLAP